MPLYIFLLFSCPIAFATEVEKSDREQEYSSLKKPVPIYPKFAINAFIEGDVTVEYTVTADGSVKDARVIESDSILLDQAALDSTSGYLYAPRIIAGEAVEVGGVQTIIKFRLSDEMLEVKEQQNKLQSLLDGGKNEEAIELIKLIRSSTPDKYQSGLYPVLLVQSKLERELDRHENAIEVLEYLRDKQGFDGDERAMLWFFLADSYSHTKRYIESIEAFETFMDTAVFEDPNYNYGILNKMSYLAYKIPDYELAHEYFLKARTISINNEIEEDKKTLKFAERLYKKLKDDEGLSSVRRRLVVVDPSEQNLNSMLLSYGVNKPLESLFLNYARYQCGSDNNMGFMVAMSLITFGFFDQGKEIALALQEDYDSETDKRDYSDSLLSMHELMSTSGSGIQPRSMLEFSAFQAIPETCSGAFYEQVFADADLAREDHGFNKVVDLYLTQINSMNENIESNSGSVLE